MLLLNIFIFLKSFILNDLDHTIFSNNDDFFVIKNNVLYKFQNQNLIEVNSNLKLEYDSFCFVTGSENLLIYDGGGKVLAYQNDSLNILDRSHYWRSSFNSFNFFRKNNIYSFGGYGYFNTRNNLISFDFNSKEWHNTNAKPTINLNRREVIGHYSMETDQLFIGLGWDEYDNKYTDAHVFDFKSNKWTKYAEIENVNEQHYVIINNYTFPMIIKGNEIIIFDFLNKKYTLYNSTLNNLDGIIKGHYNRKTKEFIFSRHIDGKLDFHTVSESDFLIGENELYFFKKNYLPYILFILFFASAFMFIVFFLRKKKKSNFKKIIANFLKISSSLNELDSLFLNKIIQEHPKAVKYSTLMDLLDNNLAYETKVKKVYNSKASINLTLKIYISSNEDILQIKRNPSDSRIKEFYITK